MNSLLLKPSLKIPLLAANLVCGGICSSSPNPPPTADEKRRYDADTRTRDVVKDWTSWYTPLRRRLMHTITAAEILLILAETYPSLFQDTPLAVVAFLIPARIPLSRLRITRGFFLGSLLTYVATALRLACYRTLGRHFTFHLAILPQHKLVTSGPYAFVRHPGYTASVIFNIATVLCQVGKGSWLREVVMGGSAPGEARIWGVVVGVAWTCALTGTSYLLLSRIPKEDAVLREEFGEEWDTWATRTRCRLIPGIY